MIRRGGQASRVTNHASRITRRWYLPDALGSTRQTVVGGGTLNAGRYDPWGTPIDNQISPFGFAGELQGDGGLVYLRARWYTPQQGVFTARDPFAGWAERPYSQHYFQYGYSNPVLVTDPSGRAGIKGAEKICPFGTRWDPVLEDCLPNTPVPPPTNPAEPERPQPVDPREPLEDWSGGGRRDTTGAAAPPIPIPGIGPQAGGRTGGLIGRLILIGVIACAQMMLNEGVQDTARDRPSPDHGWSFIGYHGTSSIYVRAILRKINPPSGTNFGGRSQLGIGFYVTPSWDAAEHFARIAVREAGKGDPVVLEIYARNFPKMKGAVVPRDLWWIIPSNSPLIKQFDYLFAPVSGFEHWYQIKFNPRAYRQLKARLP